MKYGSVCSGIEAASVAWESLGWEAQWYSEIEHFPSAVLAHRFPAVPNLGDMTQIHNSEHFNGNSIDLLVGGTPCQSFSVAGLRKGLDDTRGQLMLTFCELAARKRPKWVVWENVPGVLSSNKGEDLASFLGLLTGREIHPPVGGWKNSGVVEGIGSAYGVAWTVLDAQYFGVAQRRRRVFAVGYLGDWRPAAAVLFESYRLSGDIKEGRKKRKATSADAEGGVGGGGEQIATFAGNIESNTASTLQTTCDDYSRADGFNMIAHAFKVRGGSEVETGEQGGIAVAQPVPFRKAKRAQSKDDHEPWEQDEKTNTLNAFDTGDIRTTQAVVESSNRSAAFIPKNGAKARGIGYAEEQTPTLDTGCSNFGVVQPIAVDTYNYTTNEATTQTIRSQNDTEHIGAVLTPQQPTMAIRRLLPTECEILQGFPRNWTLIPYRGKPAEQCPDGPRYKACGNSMAVPCMFWLGQRIEMVEELLKEIS